MSRSLPVVDISPFVPGSAVYADLAAQDATADALHRACLHPGFFYISGHGIPEEVTRQGLDLARAFFQQPDQVKHALSIDHSDGARGYQRLGQNVTGTDVRSGRPLRDWHEALDYYRRIDDAHELRVRQLPMHGENPWPNATFQRFFEEKYEPAFLALGRAVMHALAHALHLPWLATHYTSDPFYYYRIIGYPPLQTAQAEDRVETSCGEHTDYGNLTFVNCTDEPGALQVLVDGVWISADPVPGTFVVNIGDCMNILTNDMYKATLHRVRHCNASTYRVSIPFFYEPNFDSVLAPLDALMQHPDATEASKRGEKKYTDPLRYGDHLVGKVSRNFA